MAAAVGEFLVPFPDASDDRFEAWNCQRYYLIASSNPAGWNATALYAGHLGVVGQMHDGEHPFNQSKGQT